MKFYWVLASTRVGYVGNWSNISRYIWGLVEFISWFFLFDTSHNSQVVTLTAVEWEEYMQRNQGTKKLTHTMVISGGDIFTKILHSLHLSVFFVQIAHLIFCNPDITALPPVECRECVLEISVWKYKNVDSSFLNSPTLHMSIIEVIPCMSPVHR